MPWKPKILALAGSTRRESYNRQMVQVAARGAERAGAQVTLLDLKEFPLPLYDEDLETEQGMPENAARLKALMIEHDGLLISSPEYNSSMPAVLKNAIDWASRRGEGEPRLVAFTGKIAVVMAASPGSLGGLRGLVHLRSILGNIGVIVLPEQYALPKAHEAFHPDGTLKDANQQERVEDLGRRLARFLQRLGPPRAD